jgi:outer membrane biosynthesis protein TonB
MQAGTFPFVWVLINSMNRNIWLAALAVVFVLGIPAYGQQKSTNAPSKRKTVRTNKPFTISCSFCAQQAISLPKPDYAHINRNGSVSVDILIDEFGNVISAKAVSGHPMLRAASVNAARKARFSVVKLNGNPVRVRTTIVYNFVR